MRKTTLLLMTVVLSLALVNVANANVLLNPGFESGNANWTVGGSATVETGDPARAHTGNNYGEVQLNLSGYFSNLLLFLLVQIPSSMDLIFKSSQISCLVILIKFK